MAANVETMFSVREMPWHGQGLILADYPTYDAAIKASGLQWEVEKVKAVQRLKDGTIRELPGEFEIRRETDGQHYGFVKETYVPFQNQELFDLAREMVGLGAKIETAGSLDKGRVTWMCAKTEGSTFAEEFIQDYYILTNTHGGGGAIRAAISPIRVVCQNTLNASLGAAKRSWSYRHTTNVKSHVDEAIQTLKNGQAYMEALGQEIDQMKRAKISEEKARQVLDTIVVQETASKLAKIETLKKVTPFNRADYFKSLEKIETLQNDVLAVKDDLYARYFDAPDLQHLDNNQFRLWNAISDYATHTDLHKNTKGYQQKLFLSVASDNNTGKAKLIDLGYKLAKAA
jgi:phage/plasmid-like protein (TIGR03299 family)